MGPGLGLNGTQTPLMRISGGVVTHFCNFAVSSPDRAIPCLDARSHAVVFSGDAFELQVPELFSEGNVCFGYPIPDEYEPITGSLSCGAAITVDWDGGATETFDTSQAVPGGAASACGF